MGGPVGSLCDTTAAQFILANAGTLLFSTGFQRGTISTSPMMTEPLGWWTKLQNVSCKSLRTLYLHMDRAMSTVSCSNDLQHCFAAEPVNSWPLSLHISHPATSSTGRTAFLRHLSCIHLLLMGGLYSTLQRKIWETTSAGDRPTVSEWYIHQFKGGISVRWCAHYKVCHVVSTSAQAISTTCTTLSFGTWYIQGCPQMRQKLDYEWVLCSSVHVFLWWNWQGWTVKQG